MQEFDKSTRLRWSQKSPLAWIFELLMQRKILFTAVMLGIIIHQTMRFVVPILIGDLVELGIEAGDVSQVKRYALLILVVGVTSAFFDMTMSWGNEVIANDIEFKVRSIYFRTIQQKKMSFHEDAKVGELMAIAQNDMQSLYRAMSPGIRIMGEAVVSILAITIIIFFESWILGIIFLLISPIWYYSLKLYNDRITPVAIDQQNQFRDLSAQVQENLSSAQIVKAFTQEIHEIELFTKKNEDLTSLWDKRGQVTAFYFPMLISYLVAGIMFLSAAYLVRVDSITIGTLTVPSNFGIGNLVTVVTLIIMFRGPTFLVGNVIEFLSLGLAGVKKIQVILGTEETLPVAIKPVSKEINGKIEFKDVSFGYDSKTILQDISFEVMPGDIVAIIGSTGSGKSTILKLLTRFYDVSSGQILLDDTDIRDYDPDYLRQSIAVVEQDVFLFSTSILENIVYALEDDTYDEEKLNHVLQVSQVSEFVDALPDKLETVVGERGVRLSGGQKQRIGIARAFLADPKILVLDDSTSAVDAKTEQEIVTAMNNIMKNRTSFIITSRLNMIRQATKVFVLDKGKIAAQGTHEQLIQENKIYRRIFDPHMKLPEVKS